MRLLLDTNILIALTPRNVRSLDGRMAAAVEAAENACSVSVVSLWEIAIKTRLGKLQLGGSPADFASFVEALGFELIPIIRDHVLAEVEPEPKMRDPFDRLLLAICQVEGLRLVTLDRALASHALAWR